MDRDPQTRWSMAEAADALRRVASDAERPRTTPLTVPATVPADTAQPHHHGRGALLALATVLALAIVIGIGVTLLGTGPGSSPSAAPTGDGPRESGSGSAEPTPSKEPEPTESGSTAPSKPTSSEPAPSSTAAAPAPAPAPGAKSPQGFVSDYYAALPDDTESAWSRLTSGFQSEIGSYDDYQGFWSTIRDVSVDSTDPAGRRAVDVTLTYTDSDGGTEREVRRIFLERSSGEMLISGDEVVG